MAKQMGAKRFPDGIFISKDDTEAWALEVKNYISEKNKITVGVLEDFVTQTTTKATTYTTLRNAGKITGPENANKLLVIFENPSNPISQSVKNEIPKLATENNLYIMVVKLEYR